MVSRWVVSREGSLSSMSKTKILRTSSHSYPHYFQIFVTHSLCRNNFSFKCHRRDQSPTQKDQSLVYAVNDITFHPVHGTFSTCGSDGTINFWDKDARTRLKSTSHSYISWDLSNLGTYPYLPRPRSFRTRPRPSACNMLQPYRHHLRVCRLLRLVEGPFGDDSWTP